MPQDWKPTAEHRDFAVQYGLYIELESAAFRGHYEGSELRNWNGMFTKWLATQAKWNMKHGPSKASGKLAPPQRGLADSYEEGEI